MSIISEIDKRDSKKESHQQIKMNTKKLLLTLLAIFLSSFAVSGQTLRVFGRRVGRRITLSGRRLIKRKLDQEHRALSQKRKGSSKSPKASKDDRVLKKSEQEASNSSKAPSQAGAKSPKASKGDRVLKESEQEASNISKAPSQAGTKSPKALKGDRVLKKSEESKSSESPKTSKLAQDGRSVVIDNTVGVVDFIITASSSSSSSRRRSKGLKRRQP